MTIYYLLAADAFGEKRVGMNVAGKKAAPATSTSTSGMSTADIGR